MFFQKRSFGYGRPQKSRKKRQAKTLLLQIRCTPIALPAPRPELLISGVPPLCLIFDPKPIIPLRTSPKKSKKTSSENITLTIIEHPYRTCGSGGSCGMIFKLFSARCFFFKNIDDMIPPLKIDEHRCTVVQNRWKSTKNVVLSCFAHKNR